MESTRIAMEYIWLIAGAILILFEFVTFGFIVIFFGLGAIITAITTWIGMTPGIAGQTLVFGVSSVVLLFTLRKLLKQVFIGRTEGVSDSDDDFIGREAPVLLDIPGGNGDGRIEVKGSEWNARADHPIPQGAIVRIERRDEFTFYVRDL